MTTKKRLFAAFVSLCLIVSMLPTAAFAEAGAQDSGIVTGASGLCEHHTRHDESCGYTEGTAEIPCSHEHTEDCYTLVTECVHEHTADCYSDGILPVDGEEKTADVCSHVCSEESGCITKTLDCKHEHDEACGYVPATEGTPCTFVCEVCDAQDSGNPATPSDAQPEECTCETLCTEEEINGDCSVCSAERDELDKVCTGAAPMLAAAAPLSGEHSSHDGWKELSGTINDSLLPAGNYVLTGDVTLNSYVTFGDSTVICLNGHKINGNENLILSTNALTICDCTGEGRINNSGFQKVSLTNVRLSGTRILSGSAETNINSGTYVDAGCEIITQGGSDSVISINNGAKIGSSVTIELKGGTLNLNGASVNSPITAWPYSTCNISGTTEIKNSTEEAPAVNVRGGTCNITGGTISSPIVMTAGTCNITGGDIKNIWNTSESGDTTGAVIVKGGTCNIGGTAQITENRIDNGGAVSVLGGSCTISGNTVHNNTTKSGGVYVAGGTCTIENDAVISENTATNTGAGVHIDGGTCDIYGTITDNTARYTSNGHGGGVSISAGECDIYGTITKNTATVNGGGVYAAGGTCNIYGAVTENTAVNGGGVYVAPGAQVNTKNGGSSGLSRITKNTASANGGGVYLSGGTEWDNVCDITLNNANAGGGIFGMDGCHLTIRLGSISYNTAQLRGGGLYLSDSSENPCIVDITNWVIKNNDGNNLKPDNIDSLGSKITYDRGLSAQDTLPYDEPGSIILRNTASFTIMGGKYTAANISSCFTRYSDNKILIAGGFYDKDPAQEPTLTVLDNVKVIKLDGDIGYNQYDPNYPWAVYPVKDGIMSGTSNNPVYDGASIEKDVDFSLSRTADIQKLFYWYKAQGAEDSSYVAGLPSNAGNYTIKAGGLHLRTIGEEYYTECTFDLTIAKADPSYTVPAGITAQVGKPLSTVTLPEGWKWKDESTIPQTEGTQTYPAIFTPDDTANYNTVETDISVEVEHAHNGVLVEEVPATCTQTGVKAYYECSICQKYFEDEACNKPIADLDSWKVIPVLGHDFGGWTSNENGTHTGTCQREGCDATDTQNCSGGEATYFLKAECEICGGAYGELKEDTTLPTGEIRINENKWNKFLNTITFGLFFKETQSVVITADDDSYSMAGYTDDKAAVIEYYLYDGDAALSQEELEDKEFTTYTGSLNMEPNGKYTIYVRITDHAGNKTYISSDGIVMYTDAKQDTESISFVKTTTEDVTASVFTNGNTVKEIRNGATVLSDSDYSVSYEGNKATITFKAAYLDTLTAGGYTLTLSYNPLGMEYQDGNGSEAPSDTTITLTVNQQSGTITNISDISKIYDDTAVSAPTYDSLSTGTAVIEYKVKDADDSTYTQTAPNTVGEYTVRITVAADGNYAEASATRDFTISYLTAPQEPYTLIGSAGTNGWYTGDVTLKPADGYTVSTTLNGTYSAQLNFAQTTEGFTIYLKNSVGQMTDAITVGTIKIDKTAPDGDILFEKNSVKEFINNITFGLFFNKNIDVEITGTDDLSGVAKIEYYRSDKILTGAEVAAITDWTETNGKFSVTAEDQVNFIYYVKITDQAGNQTYFGSDGATFDTMKPVIKGITDGKIYCEEQTFTVEETNLESVLIDGVAATPDNTGNYTLPAGNKQYTITVTDKAGNSTLCTVTVNDGHDWNEAIYTWNDDGSSCTASRTCKNDSDHVETAEADITSKPGKEPTCTENGETIYTATFTVEWASEQSKTIADVPALGHKLTKTEANAPTCTEAGNKEYWTCDTCGKIFSDAEGKTEISLEDTVIKATGHKLTKTEAKAPTCTEAGNKEYWACDTCGKIFSDAEGKTEISLEDTVIPATGHKLTKTEAKTPTCTEDGNKEYWTCDTCGKHFSDAEGKTEISLEDTVIPATGHKLTKIEAKTPTCTEDGNKEYWTCDTCGKHFSDAEGKTEISLEDTVIPATGHKLTKTEEKQPTCTEDGNKEYWTCDTCGKHFSDAEGNTEVKLEDTVIKATGHGATELKNQKEATCTEEGYTGDKVCKECGTVLEKGKSTPKIAHNYKNGKCTVCDKSDPNYKSDTDSPQTGDNSNMILWMVMLFVSAGILGIAAYGKQKKKKNS